MEQQDQSDEATFGLIYYPKGDLLSYSTKALLNLGLEGVSNESTCLLT